MPDVYAIPASPGASVIDRQSGHTFRSSGIILASRAAIQPGRGQPALSAQRWQIPMTTAVPGFSTSSGNRSAMIVGLWRRKNAEPAQNRELRRALDKPADRARRARRDAESRAGVRAASPARSCGPAGAGTAPCRCERRGFSLYQRYFRLEGWTRGASRMLPGPTVNGWAN